MNKNIVKTLVMITVVSVIISLSHYTYTNFIRKYELMINDEVVYTASKCEFMNNYEDKINEYKNDLINSARERVIYEISEDIELENYETIKVVIDEFERDNYIYALDIEVVHEVPISKATTLPFEKKEVTDPNVWNTFSEVTQDGLDGEEVETYVSIYNNGKFVTIKDYDVKVKEPIAQITTKGGREPSTASGSNWTGSNSGNTWTGGGYVGGGSSGGSSGGIASPSPTPSTPPAPTGAFSSEAACMNYGQANAGPSGGYGCLDRDGDGYWDVYFF